MISMKFICYSIFVGFKMVKLSIIGTVFLTIWLSYVNPSEDSGSIAQETTSRTENKPYNMDNIAQKQILQPEAFDQRDTAQTTTTPYETTIAMFSTTSKKAVTSEDASVSKSGQPADSQTEDLYTSTGTEDATLSSIVKRSQQSSAPVDDPMVSNPRCYSMSWRFYLRLDLFWNVCPPLKQGQSQPTVTECYQLERLYRGFFKRKQALIMKTDNAVGDGDMCCPTTTSLVKYDNLTNINGEVKELVHLTLLDIYQWVNVASCTHRLCLTGVGQCFIEHVVEYLLVWDLASSTSPLVFDAFLIPKYCSCKNIL